MKVNLSGAARNAYCGIKDLIDIITDFEEAYGTDFGREFIEDLNQSIVRNQPQASAWSANEVVKELLAASKIEDDKERLALYDDLVAKR